MHFTVLFTATCFGSFFRNHLQAEPSYLLQPSTPLTIIPLFYVYLYLFFNYVLNTRNFLILRRLPPSVISPHVDRYIFNPNHLGMCGPGSIDGIVTGYGLHRRGIETRWGAWFSAPVQTGPGAHPASGTMGTRSFPGLNSGRSVTLTPRPF